MDYIEACIFYRAAVFNHEIHKVSGVSGILFRFYTE